MRYYEPGFVDNQMDLVSYDILLEALSASRTEMVKFCRWKGQNCLEDRFWVTVMTRIGLCRQLVLPDREVSLSEEKLQLILG